MTGLLASFRSGILPSSFTLLCLNFGLIVGACWCSVVIEDADEAMDEYVDCLLAKGLAVGSNLLKIVCGLPGC